MKKSRALGFLGFALAMASAMEDSFPITERGNVGSGDDSKPNQPTGPTPFNKQDGVLKTIQDYNLILNGKSKKGKAKQSRIKSKVKEWLELGWIKESDLNI